LQDSPPQFVCICSRIAWLLVLPLKPVRATGVPLGFFTVMRLVKENWSMFWMSTFSWDGTEKFHSIAAYARSVQGEEAQGGGAGFGGFNGRSLLITAYITAFDEPTAA
jgi:hypothetical protein